MTEFAGFTGKNTPAGYSSRGGQVVSPFNRKYSPSGSSTGSAVAVAARLCTAALGTENFGSINHPAQQNGIVGIKPTIGLVSRYGNFPTTNTLITGFPSMSIPIGTHENRMPIGSYWIARRYNENKLIQIIYAVENLLNVHCIPDEPT